MKFISWLLMPLSLGVFGCLLGSLLLWRGRRRWGLTVIITALAWLWLWATPGFLVVAGGALERQFPPQNVNSLPRADAIVVLGGGVGAPGTHTVYPELFSAADRGWHAARCYHAGRAPLILFSGTGEGPGMKRFLIDLGVPAKKIILESESRNTYQNGLFTKDKLAELKLKRVILVTSAWHMRRSVLTFEKLGVEVIPAAADYEALSMAGGSSPRSLNHYLPNADCLNKNTAVFKEYLGYWAYWAWLKRRAATPTQK